MTVDSTELQRRNCELTFLKSIAEELNRSVDIHQALNATLAQIAELFDLQTAWIYLVDDEDGPDHAKVFTVEVMVEGEVLGIGRGNSKKLAEQRAAVMALERLRNP